MMHARVLQDKMSGTQTTAIDRWVQNGHVDEHLRSRPAAFFAQTLHATCCDLAHSGEVRTAIQVLQDAERRGDRVLADTYSEVLGRAARNVDIPLATLLHLFSEGIARHSQEGGEGDEARRTGEAMYARMVFTLVQRRCLQTALDTVAAAERAGLANTKEFLRALLELHAWRHDREGVERVWARAQELDEASRRWLPLHVGRALAVSRTHEEPMAALVAILDEVLALVGPSPGPSEEANVVRIFNTAIRRGGSNGTEGFEQSKRLLVRLHEEGYRPTKETYFGMVQSAIDLGLRTRFPDSVKILGSIIATLRHALNAEDTLDVRALRRRSYAFRRAFGIDLIELLRGIHEGTLPALHSPILGATPEDDGLPDVRTSLAEKDTATTLPDNGNMSEELLAAFYSSRARVEDKFRLSNEKIRELASQEDDWYSTSLKEIYTQVLNGASEAHLGAQREGQQDLPDKRFTVYLLRALESLSSDAGPSEPKLQRAELYDLYKSIEMGPAQPRSSDIEHLDAVRRANMIQELPCHMISETIISLRQKERWKAALKNVFQKMNDHGLLDDANFVALLSKKIFFFAALQQAIRTNHPSIRHKVPAFYQKLQYLVRIMEEQTPHCVSTYAVDTVIGILDGVDDMDPKQRRHLVDHLLRLESRRGRPLSMAHIRGLLPAVPLDAAVAEAQDLLCMYENEREDLVARQQSRDTASVARYLGQIVSLTANLLFRAGGEHNARGVGLVHDTLRLRRRLGASEHDLRLTAQVVDRTTELHILADPCEGARFLMQLDSPGEESALTSAACLAALRGTMLVRDHQLALDFLQFCSARGVPGLRGEWNYVGAD